MDTRAVADRLGTDAKTLRRFLRSSASSATPVGSSNRYDFTDRQIPTVAAEFAVWASNASAPAPVVPRAPKTRQRPSGASRDAIVWAEEGDVVLEDLRDPRVRAYVRARARAEEEALNARLLQLGLHVTQMRDRVPVNVG